MTGSATAPDAVPGGAIVVGVDGSAMAERAVAWAAQQAALEDRPLVVAHSLGTIGTPEAAGLHFEGGTGFTLVYEQLRADGEALVAAATAKVAETEPSVEVTAVIEHGDPRQLLLRLSENAALVVIGSRGRGPFRSLLLGSVTSTVAGRAGCPVVVVPGPPDPE